MVQKLSPRFERMIRPGADGREASAADVLRLSDYFHTHPGAPTPWHEDYTQRAYPAYFLPLNYARVRDSFREVHRFIPESVITEIWDFGSGPGTLHWVLEDEPWLCPRPFVCIERSSEAIAMHRDLATRSDGRWKPQIASSIGRRPSAGALAVFSYSFLEMQNDLPDLSLFAHVLVIEPSTRECGRRLQEWRPRFMNAGFHILAPCTHAGPCPLLEHSQRDWCHMRVSFEGPDWWRDLEDKLPMKNRTLTYSYLLVSRSISDDRFRSPIARVIGDTLHERGKTRQMICRGPQREFLSWLHRHGEPPVIPHGSLLNGTETCEPKSGELRVGPQSQLAWSE